MRTLATGLMPWFQQFGWSIPFHAVIPWKGMVVKPNAVSASRLTRRATGTDAGG